MTCNIEVFRTVVGGPPFVLSGPQMLADFNEGMFKELQVGQGGLLLYAPFQISVAERIWRCYVGCINQPWQIKS